MSKWVGYAVSVNCGETLGCYQGTILDADSLTITLTKAFRNGFPYPKSKVTLNAVDIKDLRIIEARSERAETHSTVVAVAPPATSRKSRATVCETLQANPTSTGNQTLSSSNSKSANSRNTNQAPMTRTKPVEILAPRNKNHNNQQGSYGSGSTPKSRGNGFGGRSESTGLPGMGGVTSSMGLPGMGGVTSSMGLPGMGGVTSSMGLPGMGGVTSSTSGLHERARRRNEACFGDAAEPALDDDFDFEGNLALFDKRAMWASMRNSKPDIVRTTDESKYRHDENVLGGAAGAGAGHCVVIPEALRGGMEYVTDEGVVVGSVSPGVRRDLWEAMQRHGLVESALTLIARATVDVALRLVGGGRRLEARNAHQAPCVVCVAGAHRGGAGALAAARLLASRGVRPHLHVAGRAPHCAALQRELAALQLDQVPIHASLADLPTAPDLVLIALYDPLLDNDQDQYRAVCEWASSCRAACVAVEPAGGGWAGVSCRACVMGVACVPLPEALGRLYLADVAAPQRLYAERALRYRPPYGAAAVLPLHPHH